MQLKPKEVMPIVLIIGILVLTVFAQSTRAVSASSAVTDTMYIPREPIIIGENASFSAYGFPGNGSLSDPYRIEGYDIYAMDGGHCISISLVSCHYIISDCILHGSTDADTSAIYIYKNSYGIISGCEIYNCSIGIELSDNLFDEAYLVHDTHISDFTYVGVLMQDAGNIELENVSAIQDMAGLDADYGVRIQNSKNISFVECRFTNHTGAWGAGIYSEESDAIEILGCSFYGASHIQLEHHNSNITVSGCTLVDSEIHITGAGNSGRITVTDNTLKLYYTDWEWSRGILVGSNESEAFVARNTIEGYATGIDTYDSSDTIAQNTLIHCSVDGIRVIGDRNVVTNNTLTHCGHGIGVSGSNNTVTTNMLLSNDIGIRLFQLFSDCSDNSLFYNRFVSNTVSATDDGLSNTWDDSDGLGNYWDDFPPSQTGVYNVTGSAGSVDRWPIYVGEEMPPSSTTTTTSGTTGSLDTEVVILVTLAGVSIVIVAVAIISKKR